MAYDQTPVRQKFKSARLPDGNRIWLALGVDYKVSKRCSVDLGYAHIFIEQTHIDRTQVTPVGTATLIANYNGSGNVYGAQINYKFA